MNVSKNNLRFEYLYRDSGNYKQFGQIILSNPNNIGAEKATEKIREKLIDGEFFYPLEVGVPQFNVFDFDLEKDWYEFIKFSSTEENPSEVINAKNFIAKF